MTHLHGRNIQYGCYGILIPVVCFSLALFLEYIVVPAIDQRVYVNPSSWDWLLSAHFNAEPLDPLVLKAIDSEIKKPKWVQMTPYQLARIKKHFSSGGFSKTPILGKVGAVDHLVLSAAAPTSPSVFEGSHGDLMDKEKFKAFHRILSARLLIALNVPAATLSATTFANPSLPDEGLTSKRHPLKNVSMYLSTHPITIQKSIHAAPQKKLRAKAPVKPQNETSASTVEIKNSPQPAERKIASLGRPTYEPAAATEEEEESQKLTIESRQEFNQLIPDKFRQIAETISESDKVPDISLANLGPVLDDLYYRGLSDLVKGLGGSESTQIVTTQAAPSPTLPPVNVVPVTPPVVARQDRPSPADVLLEEVSFVEALDIQKASLVGVDTQPISNELADQNGSRRGWELATQGDHGATLFWKDPKTMGAMSVPLLHSNTIRGFGATALAGVDQQSSAGIIYGKVKAGWTVDVASQDVVGSSEPLLLNSQALKVSNDAKFEGERFFVLLNVNPGARIIYLRPESGTVTGGLAVPVLPGIATYLDLTEISTRQTLSGVLYDEMKNGSEDLWPLSGSTVRILGQPFSVAVTDANGTFRFEEVVTASSYPLQLESYKVLESDQGVLKHLGYKHRYRVSPDQMDQVNLFRISRRDIRSWVEQIPFQTSWDSGLSGLLVAAFTQLEKIDPSLRLVASVQAIPTSANLTPIAYTLSADGALGAIDGLQAGYNRVVGAELPKGPVVLKITDLNQQKDVMSELIFADPEVVNMVGPYPLDQAIRN